MQPETQPETSTRDVTFDHQSQSITGPFEAPESHHHHSQDRSAIAQKPAQDDQSRENDTALRYSEATHAERNNLYHSEEIGHPSRTTNLHIASETIFASSSDQPVALNKSDERRDSGSLLESLSKVDQDHGPPPPTQDARSNSSGTKTPTRNDPWTYNSSQSLSQSPQVHYHSGAQPDPLRDAGSIIAPNKQSRAAPLSTTHSHPAAVRVNSVDKPAHPHTEGPASSQSATNRLSEDSNGTFQTAEDGNPSRPGSETMQDNIETPKAGEPQILDTEISTWPDREDRTPTGRRPSTAGAFRAQTADPQTECLPHPNQAHYEPSSPRGEYLAREPSLDNIPSQLDFDRSPSPVSPQLSIHNEPLRRQSTREPTYYGPRHDFGPKQTHDFPSRGQRSRSQSREPEGLQDHPAFRSAPGMNYQEQDKTLEHSTMSMHGQPHPGYLPDESGSSTNQMAESKPKSNRNSRNSGFFKNLGSSGKVGVSPTVSPADMQAQPSSTMTPNENDKRFKRNSLFRSRPGDKGSDGAPSVGSSPVPGPAAGVETLRQSSPSTSKSSQHDEPSKAASNTRSSRAQPKSKTQASQTQQGPGAQFAPPQQTVHQNSFSAHKPSAEQSYHQPRSSQSQRDFSSSDPNQADYNARSDTLTSQVPNPLWNQAAERVSQPRQPSLKEPSAYVQDANLRQRAASPSNPSEIGAVRTSTSFAQNVPSGELAVKQRTSFFSRSKSRESSISGRNRDSSGKSWVTGREPDRADVKGNLYSRQSQPPSTRPPMQHNSPKSAQDAQRVLTSSQSRENHITTNPAHEQQILQSRKTDQQSQPASSPLPPRTSSLGNYLPSQGAPRILTFNQFGENHIAENPSQIPPATASRQGSVVQGQQPDVVTFQQFPSTSKAQQLSRGGSPTPPPPPPKDDWHVSVPRQLISQNTGSESRERPQDGLNRTSITAPPSDPDRQRIPHAQPQPDFRAQQRQAPPPIQTEIPSSRLSAFSPSSNSAESRKARQRELEVAVPSTEKETVVAPPKHDASSEERIVMSSSSYPGQEWQPSFAYDD